LYGCTTWHRSHRPFIAINSHLPSCHKSIHKIRPSPPLSFQVMSPVASNHSTLSSNPRSTYSSVHRISADQGRVRDRRRHMTSKNAFAKRCWTFRPSSCTYIISTSKPLLKSGNLLPFFFHHPKYPRDEWMYQALKSIYINLDLYGQKHASLTRIRTIRRR
jgi:hypothetical protein